MSNKLIRPTMSLKEFMLKQQVLKLYRDILRTIKEVPTEEDRKQLREWAKNDFLANKHHSDEACAAS